MNTTRDEDASAPRATKRKAGWIVALAIVSGIAVLVPSFVALATSVFAAAVALFSQGQGIG